MTNETSISGYRYISTENIIGYKYITLESEKAKFTPYDLDDNSIISQVVREQEHDFRYFPTKTDIIVSKGENIWIIDKYPKYQDPLRKLVNLISIGKIDDDTHKKICIIVKIMKTRICSDMSALSDTINGVENRCKTYSEFVSDNYKMKVNSSEIGEYMNDFYEFGVAYRLLDDMIEYSTVRNTAKIILLNKTRIPEELIKYDILAFVK